MKNKTIYASFGKRFLAFGLDTISLIIVCLCFWYCMEFIAAKSGQPFPEIPRPGHAQHAEMLRKADEHPLILFTGYVWVFLAWAHMAWWQKKHGQTWGKKMLGLKVVSTKGRPLGIFQMTCRFLMAWLSIGFYAIGFFIALFNEKNRSLGDFATGTCVVDLSRMEQEKEVSMPSKDKAA